MEVFVAVALRMLMRNQPRMFMFMRVFMGVRMLMFVLMPGRIHMRMRMRVLVRMLVLVAVLVRVFVPVFVSLGRRTGCLGRLLPLKYMHLGRRDAAAIHLLNPQGGIKRQRRHGILKSARRDADIEQGAQEHVSGDTGKTIKIDSMHEKSTLSFGACSRHRVTRPGVRSDRIRPETIATRPGIAASSLLRI
jgi:hypothetical protein